MASMLPPFSVRNPHLVKQGGDVLYHFGFSTATNDFERQFGDIRFVCCGGTADRMRRLALHLQIELGINPGLMPQNLVQKTERYSIYKVGPVLCVSHGIGMPSISVMLVEMLKLLHYAKCIDPIFIRIGTSGGIGIEAGTVVVTRRALNGLIKPIHTQFVLGKQIDYSTEVDNNDINSELIAIGHKIAVPVATGDTMGANDFFEEQGRMDGAFCTFDENDRMEFLQRLNENGVRNIEMESPAFFSFLNRSGLRGAIVCVALLNRLNGDQVSTPKEILLEWEERPVRLVAAYIKQQLLAQSSH